jgi:hypothetical protein
MPDPPPHIPAMARPRRRARCVARSRRSGPAWCARPRPRRDPLPLLCDAPHLAHSLTCRPDHGVARGHGAAPARGAARPPPPRALLPPCATPRRGLPYVCAPTRFVEPAAWRDRGAAPPPRHGGPPSAAAPCCPSVPAAPPAHLRRVARHARLLRLGPGTTPAACALHARCSLPAACAWLVRGARGAASSRCPWPRSMRPCVHWSLRNVCG